MSELREVETGLVWKVQCRECEANLSARGLKSVPEAERFITGHSEKTGHTLFDMNVLAHSIYIEVIDCVQGRGKGCA